MAAPMSLQKSATLCSGKAFRTALSRRCRTRQATGRRNSVQVVSDAAAPVALVTGGSRGIGRATCLALASGGAKVAVNYASNSAAADEVVQMIKDAGGDAFALGADVSKKADIDAMISKVVETYGTLDVLVNNAGITKDTLIMRMKPEQWDAVISTNLSSVFYASQAALKVMSKKKTGRIINISSVVGLTGNVGQANYAAAKAGILGLTKTIAREYAGRSITANAVCPGFIASDMTAALSKNIEEAVLKTIPLARYGKAEEVGGLIKFLALDPAAAYMTGQVLQIDGGMVM